jgi:hypothetical protein
VKEDPVDLHSPAYRDTRHTAYVLPTNVWSLGVGALGIGAGDVFAKLGVGYGIGGGFQVELNLAHASVGLLNVAAHWHFIDTRYFDLGAGVGLWYGHGGWFWIADDVTKDLVSKLDVLNVPLSLTASLPVLRSLQFDVGVEYTYAQVFGTMERERSLFQDAGFGVRQLTFSPGVHWYIWHNTSLELSSRLPALTEVPVQASRGDAEHAEYHDVPFSDAWSVEVGLRSRLRSNVFGNLRLHYGEVARTLYGARIYPSFELEIRL